MFTSESALHQEKSKNPYSIGLFLTTQKLQICVLENILKNTKIKVYRLITNYAKYLQQYFHEFKQKVRCPTFNSRLFQGSDGKIQTPPPMYAPSCSFNFEWICLVPGVKVTTNIVC